MEEDGQAMQSATAFAATGDRQGQKVLNRVVHDLETDNTGICAGLADDRASESNIIPK